MRILFYVDPAAAIRGGYSRAGLVELEFDPSGLPQADRDLIAARYGGPTQKVKYVMTRCGRGIEAEATAPTIEALIDALRSSNAEAAKLNAVRLVQEDKELADQEAIHAEVLRERRTKGVNGYGSRVEPAETYHGLIYAKGRVEELRTWNSPEWKQWVAELDAGHAAFLAAVQAVKEADKLAKASAYAAGVQSLRDWATTNGSELTRLRLAEGYESWVSSAVDDFVVDRVEDFSIDGFERTGSMDGYECECEERKSPSTDEILALKRIRPLLRPNESATLQRVTYTASVDDDSYEEGDEPITVTEIQVRITLPHGFAECIFLTIPTV